jgi:hypothetical protein
MHLVVAGEVDFLKLRSTEAGLELGWSPSSHCEPESNNLQLTLRFTRNLNSTGKEIQWTTISFHKERKNPQLLETLHLQCSNSYLHLETLEVSTTFSLELSGSSNTVVLSACDHNRFTLAVTGHENRITFDNTMPVHEIYLSVSGWRNFIENLWLLGSILSTMAVRNESILTVMVQQELNERQLKFIRDGTSTITVTMPAEGQRNVQSLYELWSLDSTLLCIETQRIRKSDPPPPEPMETTESIPQRTICIICRDSIPDLFLLPCRHLCFCQKCCQELSAREMTTNCPICRSGITSIERVFNVVGC